MELSVIFPVRFGGFYLFAFLVAGVPRCSLRSTKIELDFVDKNRKQKRKLFI
jgi:hypothetical protein